MRSNSLGIGLASYCRHNYFLEGVDSSLPALEIANENIVLNGLDPGRISFLRQDATEFMKNAITKGESWDIVILDPPKLAPRRKVLYVPIFRAFPRFFILSSTNDFVISRLSMTVPFLFLSFGKRTRMYLLEFKLIFLGHCDIFRCYKAHLACTGI